REVPGLLARRYAGQRLTVPVRFLVGSEDRLFYEGLVEEPIPHADADYRGEVLRGIGHFMADEAPDLLRERVLGFLGVPQGTGGAPRKQGGAPPTRAGDATTSSCTIRRPPRPAR